MVHCSAYEDEPPPYESVARSPTTLTTLPSLPPYDDGGLVNPALEDGIDSLPLPLPPNWVPESSSELDPPPVYTPQPSPVHRLDIPAQPRSGSQSPEPIHWILDPNVGERWCTGASSPEPAPPPTYEGDPVCRSRSASPCPASWLDEPRPPPPSYEEVLASVHATAQSTSHMPAASGSTTVNESAIIPIHSENIRNFLASTR